MQLIEEAVDGCWIGHRARTAIMGDTGIGSVYSPPEDLSAAKQLVETVVDIGWRKGVRFLFEINAGGRQLTHLQGWSLKCEKGGIRRVLMNVFGNSLKFTTVCGTLGSGITWLRYVSFQNGYVHVMLRELPRSGDEAANEAKIELIVLDTGKVCEFLLICMILIYLAQGISENFRKVIKNPPVPILED